LRTGLAFTSLCQSFSKGKRIVYIKGSPKGRKGCNRGEPLLLPLKEKFLYRKSILSKQEGENLSGRRGQVSLSIRGGKTLSEKREEKGGFS